MKVTKLTSKKQRKKIDREIERSITAQLEFSLSNCGLKNSVGLLVFLVLAAVGVEKKGGSPFRSLVVVGWITGLGCLGLVLHCWGP